MSEVQTSTLINHETQQNTDVPRKRKLPFGHFKARMTHCNFNNEKYIRGDMEDVVTKGLTQDELADGWSQNIPKMRKQQHVHHWSVNLAQLPENLWFRYRPRYDNENKLFYPIIRDGIYHYSVTQTEYDDIIKQLYTEVCKDFRADKQRLNHLVSQLDNKINGWLVVRARKMMK